MSLPAKLTQNGSFARLEPYGPVFRFRKGNNETNFVIFNHCAIVAMESIFKDRELQCISHKGPILKAKKAAGIGKPDE